MNRKHLRTILMCCCLVIMLSTSTTIGMEDQTQQQQAAQNQTLTIHAFFKSPTIQEITIQGVTYHTIHCTDGKEVAIPGSPLLPRFQKTVLLPPQTKVKTIQITLEAEQRLTVGTILPAETPTLLTETPTTSSPQPNQAIYGSSAPYPTQPVTDIGIQQFRGYQIQYLDVCPFQYIPTTGQLTFYQSITIELQLEPALTQTALYRGLPQDQDAVQNIVENPDLLPAYTERQSSLSITLNQKRCNLLLITTEPLRYAFQPLINDHNQKGITTKVMILGRDILQSHDANITCSNIRDAIRDAYTHLGVEYVLIGGDMDIIPAQILYFGTHDEVGE